MSSLEDMMNELEDIIEPKKVMKPPFAYTGGKGRSLDYILPYIPYRDSYVEPFGGSASVLLARQPSSIEIFNDRYAGVTAFYRCMRDQHKMYKMVSWLEMTVNSREEWEHCRATWNNSEDDVERAAKWYYMAEYSFNSMMRSWARPRFGNSNISGKVHGKLKNFPLIHQRFRRVTVDNRDWFDCMLEYDSKTTVFYIDPPYYGVHERTYAHELSEEEHIRLLDTIFNRKGYCAVSGIPNPLYDERDWDDRIEYKVARSVNCPTRSDANRERQHGQEVLWIYGGRD